MHTLRTDRTENNGETDGKTRARCTFSKRHKPTNDNLSHERKKELSSSEMKCVVPALCVFCHQNDIEWQNAMTVSGVERLSDSQQRMEHKRQTVKEPACLPAKFLVRWSRLISSLTFSIHSIHRVHASKSVTNKFFLSIFLLFVCLVWRHLLRRYEFSKVCEYL